MSSVNAQPDPPATSKEAVPADSEQMDDVAKTVSTSTARTPSRSGVGPFSGYRDMIISMAVLLPIVAFVAVLSRGCSFSPGGPTVDPSQMPRVDSHAVFAESARRLSFPIRDPALPANWRASTVEQRLAPGGASAVRVSWITDGGRYMRLVQTTAEEGALVADETGGGRPIARGAIPVAGQQWVSYQGANDEQAWARQAGGVIWVITGDGVDAEFSVLANAVETARPLPRVR